MPSIGKDLAKIRNARGLSLQEIQAATKIPLTTLQSIENGTIFETPSQGKTYTRSFVRSYGRALMIDDEVLINGLDQQETGNYNHLIWNHYESSRSTPVSGAFTLDDDEEVEPDQESDTDTADSDFYGDKVTASGEDSEPESRDPDVSKDPETEPENSEPGSDEFDSGEKSTASPKKEADVNWANMGHKFIETRKKTPVGIISLIIIVLLVAIAAFFLFQYDFFSSADDSNPSTTTTTTSQQDGSILDLSEPVSEESDDPAIAELDEVLYLTVYAAHQRLEPVRIWSDLKPRLDPYWIEQGIAMNFDFQDTLRIRGQYSDMLIFMNGHLIQNPMEEFYIQSDNYIELTREYFSTEPAFSDSITLQIPEDVAEPDSVLLRPSF